MNRQLLRAKIRREQLYKTDPQLATLHEIAGLSDAKQKETLSKTLGSEVNRVAVNAVQKALSGFFTMIEEARKVLHSEVMVVEERVAKQIKMLESARAGAMEHLKGENGKNGDDADEDEIVRRLYALFQKDVKARLADIKQPENGKNGSPDTPEQIKKKLKKLEGAWLDKSAIFGLDEWLDKVAKIMREKGGGSGGGGIGQTIHQVFDISSASTTVTLSNNIAGEGTCIFGARYQGQVLDLDVDYTVSGKTVTFLFTPQDNTKFSISYVRT